MTDADRWAVPDERVDMSIDHAASRDSLIPSNVAPMFSKTLRDRSACRDTACGIVEAGVAIGPFAGKERGQEPSL